MELMTQSCDALGYGALEECLVAYGLTLPPLPGTSTTTPDGQESSAPDDGPLVGQEELVSPSAVEPVPPEVAPTEAAPLLDSQKQADPADSFALEEAEEPAPPPASDAAAQAAIPKPAEQTPVTAEPGESLAEGAVEFGAPPNVTILNQTNVTNNITNNVDSSINIDNSVNVDNSTNINTDIDVSTPSPARAATGFVFELGTQVVISNPEQERRRLLTSNEDKIFYETLSGNRLRETIQRPNGVKVITIRDRTGIVLRRSRISAEGREFVLIYGPSSPTLQLSLEWEDPGEELEPLRLKIPAREYIFDADRATDVDIQVFLSQPPVEPVRRLYTIEEVKHSARIRDTVRRLEIGDLTFNTGKATVPRDQIGALRNVASAMLALLEENPAETFLIEGHADAVGSEIANLELSDRRAATVAQILTEFYNVPPENLSTQGYGEAYLKIRTQEAERLNRRVAVRRITPLVTLTE
jgi:outer membrane protein OmpA-like peptidoglycan-associated protein